MEKINPNKRLPFKTNTGNPSDDWWSDSYFVMTDNGKAVAYYDFEMKDWMITQNNYATKVLYRLEDL